jgi:hypothetical protein
MTLCSKDKPWSKLGQCLKPSLEVSCRWAGNPFCWCAFGPGVLGGVGSRLPGVPSAVGRAPATLDAVPAFLQSPRQNQSSRPPVARPSPFGRRARCTDRCHARGADGAAGALNPEAAMRCQDAAQGRDKLIAEALSVLAGK